MAGAAPGDWAIWALVAVVMVLVAVRAGLEWRRPEAGPQPGRRSWPRWAETATVWLAQGFGVGRVPVAPGTLGSLVGLLWLAVLVNTGSFWLFVAGLLLGLALAIGVCGDAARILRQPDPPSVVLDEVAAMPVCFVPWVAAVWFGQQTMPSPASFFQAPGWVQTLILFAAFRLLDVAKPWPIGSSQGLPGGWGIVVDDLLAALCVAAASAVAALTGALRS